MPNDPINPYQSPQIDSEETPALKHENLSQPTTPVDQTIAVVSPVAEAWANSVLTQRNFVVAVFLRFLASITGFPLVLFAMMATMSSLSTLRNP
ncbi:hypothetical protein [Bremerella cremea]|uniref:hypothetical protein n=1 Tax=Bremerella cremea TaxID=1031537 RepID=UPI0031E648DD